MKFLHIPIYLFFALAIFSSCVDDEFDSPPVDGERPNITVNTTLAELKAMHTLGGLEEITEEIIVSGVVIADDRSGNFFRALIIQDSTAGIEIRMNETNLFNEYAEGRRLYIKCKGMWLGDFAGITQLGSGTAIDDDGDLELTRIPSVLFDDFIAKGQWNQHVEPVVKTISQLRSSDISTLVHIDELQFLLTTCVRTYALHFTNENGTLVQESLNQDLESCINGQNIVMRSSGFASFASEMLPTGRGSVTAVYSVFGDTKQLLIRNPDDVNMQADRCGNFGVDGDLITISQVQSMFTGTAQNLTADNKISGVVISDHLNRNITDRNLVLQDGDRGIVVRFTQSHNFGVGEIMEININGVELSEFNGLLQLNNVPLTQAFTTCEIGTVVPRTATVQEILNNDRDWQSTLVEIKAVTLSGSGDFSGGSFVTDATGTINLSTRSIASFANVLLPFGEVDMTAYIGNSNGIQLAIRNLDDIVIDSITAVPSDIDLASVRAMFSGGNLVINDNLQIKGVVISDVESGNMHSQNLALQAGDVGITVRFVENHPFQLGEELTITIRGGTLNEFNGLLQITNIPLSSVTNFTSGTLPNPRVATIAEIQDNFETWESTLVRITGVEVVSQVDEGNGISTIITDGTSNIEMYTSAASNFNVTNLPSGGFNINGIVSEFTDRQVNLRNAADIN